MFRFQKQAFSENAQHASCFLKNVIKVVFFRVFDQKLISENFLTLQENLLKIDNFQESKNLDTEERKFTIETKFLADFTSVLDE
jgi:hypothetical protein